jgi:hypothetical protein
MRKVRSALSLGVFLAACGGGGGGDGGGGGIPLPGFAVGVTTGLTVANSFPDAAALGTSVVVAVSEQEAAADLNADGDTQDRIVHRLDTATGTITNLGFATVGRALSSGRFFAFLVREADHGKGSLNADPDTTDAVWHLYDPALPPSAINPRNLGVATPANGLPGAGTVGGFLLVEAESAQGRDLNFDGDLQDTFPVFVDDVAGGPLAGPPVALAPTAPIVARSGRFVYGISEAATRIDLNGDGDATDVLLNVADLRLGVPFVQPVGAGLPRAVANHPFALTENAVAFLIDEASDYNVDRNGDGDTTDAVLAVFDLTNLVESMPFNGSISLAGIAVAPTVGIGAGLDHIVVGIDERAQGQKDLNSDIDFFDAVVGWVNTRQSPGTLNAIPTLTLAQLTPLVDGPRALIAVNERNMGFTQGVDLNGDGDDADNVAFRLDMTVAPGTTTNLNRAVATMALVGDDALLGLPEIGHGSADLNGNGQVGDVVQFYVNLADPVPAFAGLGLVVRSVTFFRVAPDEVRIAALVPEDPFLAAYRDMNADGDSGDNAVLLLRLDPSRSPAVRISPLPFFLAGTGVAAPDAPLRVGDNAFAFASSEAMARADRNSDGDATDTALGYARIN